MNLLRLAWLNLWRHPTRSSLILTSIAIGLSAGMFVLSLYRGMVESRLRTVIETEVGHVQFHAVGFKPDFEPGRTIDRYPHLLDSIRSDPKVVHAGKRSLAEGMLNGVYGTAGVIIQGVDLSEESALSRLSEKIIEGRIDTNSSNRTILIGKQLAEKQKISLGGKLVLMVVDTSGELVSAAFRVGGIFRSSNNPFDERNVYVSSRILNEMLGVGENSHEYVVLLRDTEMTDSFVAGYQRQYPYLQVEGWSELSPETDLLVSAVDGYSIIVLVLIFMALSFGIVNTLLMSVMERRREFGMMTALGMSPFLVFGLVMSETFLLVLAGLPAGVMFSWGVIGYYQRVGIDFSERSPDLMRSFGFDSVLYPSFPADRLFDIVAIVFITTALSGLLPARRAIKWDPGEAMRL